MSSELASQKKISGHLVEEEFAKLIGADLNKGSKQAKRDVMDRQHNSFSVKSGSWWQIFLYSKTHWEKNTVFKGLGKISKLMIECLDAFPAKRSEYTKSKDKYKVLLAKPMQRLLKELAKPNILPAFLIKSIFNDGEVAFLAIKREDENFHVFSRDDVIRTLHKNFTLANSVARRPGEHDAQKVLFKLKNFKGIPVNTGEIEVRNDSDIHYKEMKCRFNAGKIFNLLSTEIGGKKKYKRRVYVYGSAAKKLK